MGLISEGVAQSCGTEPLTCVVCTNLAKSQNQIDFQYLQLVLENWFMLKHPSVTLSFSSKLKFQLKLLYILISIFKKKVVREDIS